MYVSIYIKSLRPIKKLWRQNGQKILEIILRAIPIIMYAYRPLLRTLHHFEYFICFEMKRFILRPFQNRDLNFKVID